MWYSWLCPAFSELSIFLPQARINKDETKSRVKESERRIDNNLAPYINKAYWWAVIRSSPDAPALPPSIHAAKVSANVHFSGFANPKWAVNFDA